MVEKTQKCLEMIINVTSLFLCRLVESTTVITYQSYFFSDDCPYRFLLCLDSVSL